MYFRYCNQCNKKARQSRAQSVKGLPRPEALHDLGGGEHEVGHVLRGEAEGEQSVAPAGGAAAGVLGRIDEGDEVHPVKGQAAGGSICSFITYIHCISTSTKNITDKIRSVFRHMPENTK